MDTRNIGAILMKVAGLVLIGMSVANLPGFFAPLSVGAKWSFGEAAATAAVIVGPLLALGILFWFFPGTIVNKIVDREPSPSTSSIDYRPLELIALAVLGIYLVARALVDAIQVVAFIVAMQTMNSDHSFISASVVSRIAAIAAQVGVGVWLCVGAKGIANMIARLRG